MVGAGSSLCNERELFMIFTTTLLQTINRTNYSPTAKRKIRGTVGKWLLWFCTCSAFGLYKALLGAIKIPFRKIP